MASLKLLIVEDDVASLELMVEVLESLEAEVRPLNDSREADDLLNDEKFDGIFLDLEMPNIDGFELAACVRKSRCNKSTPITIVTGRDDRQTMQQVFAIGATFFLQKPVDREKLTRLFQTVRSTLIENRHRYTRVPLHTEVICNVGTKTLRGMTWNLSQSGLQLETNDLQAGRTVRVMFKISHGVAIDATGVVIWTRENRQGIQFIKLGARSEQAIRNFVAEADPLAPPPSGMAKGNMGNN